MSGDESFKNAVRLLRNKSSDREAQLFSVAMSVVAAAILRSSTRRDLNEVASSLVEAGYALMEKKQ